MFGLISALIGIGVFSGVTIYNRARDTIYNDELNKQVKTYRQAKDEFFRRATNCTLERSLDRDINALVLGCQFEPKYKELREEILGTWRKYYLEKPYFIEMLECEKDINRALGRNLGDRANSLFVRIIMANKGFLSTGAVIPGIYYDRSTLSQEKYHAYQLDKILKKRGINEDLFALPNSSHNPVRLSTYTGYGNNGYIIWRPSSPFCY